MLPISKKKKAPPSKKQPKDHSHKDKPPKSKSKENIRLRTKPDFSQSHAHLDDIIPVPKPTAKAFLSLNEEHDKIPRNNGPVRYYDEEDPEKKKRLSPAMQKRRDKRIDSSKTHNVSSHINTFINSSKDNLGIHVNSHSNINQTAKVQMHKRDAKRDAINNNMLNGDARSRKVLSSNAKTIGGTAPVFRKPKSKQTKPIGPKQAEPARLKNKQKPKVTGRDEHQYSSLLNLYPPIDNINFQEAGRLMSVTTSGEIVFSSHEQSRFENQNNAPLGNSSSASSSFKVDPNALTKVHHRKQNRREVAAAIKIQKIWRGYLTRKLLEQYLVGRALDNNNNSAADNLQNLSNIVSRKVSQLNQDTLKLPNINDLDLDYFDNDIQIYDKEDTDRLNEAVIEKQMNSDQEGYESQEQYYDGQYDLRKRDRMVTYEYVDNQQDDGNNNLFENEDRDYDNNDSYRSDEIEADKRDVQDVKYQGERHSSIKPQPNIKTPNPEQQVPNRQTVQIVQTHQSHLVSTHTKKSSKNQSSKNSRHKLNHEYDPHDDDEENEEEESIDEEKDFRYYRHQRPIYSHEDIKGYIQQDAEQHQQGEDQEGFEEEYQEEYEDEFQPEIILETNQEYLESRKNSLHNRKRRYYNGIDTSNSRKASKDDNFYDCLIRGRNSKDDERRGTFQKTEEIQYISNPPKVTIQVPEKTQETETLKDKSNNKKEQSSSVMAEEQHVFVPNSTQIVAPAAHQGDFQLGMRTGSIESLVSETPTQSSSVQRLKEQEIAKWDRMISLIKNSSQNMDPNTANLLEQIMKESENNKKYLELSRSKKFRKTHKNQSSNNRTETIKQTESEEIKVETIMTTNFDDQESNRSQSKFNNKNTIVHDDEEAVVHVPPTKQEFQPNPQARGLFKKKPLELDLDNIQKSYSRAMNGVNMQNPSNSSNPNFLNSQEFNQPPQLRSDGSKYSQFEQFRIPNSTLSNLDLTKPQVNNPSSSKSSAKNNKRIKQMLENKLNNFTSVGLTDIIKIREDMLREREKSEYNKLKVLLSQRKISMEDFQEQAIRLHEYVENEQNEIEKAKVDIEKGLKVAAKVVAKTQKDAHVLGKYVPLVKSAQHLKKGALSLVDEEELFLIKGKNNDKIVYVDELASRKSSGRPRNFFADDSMSNSSQGSSFEFTEEELRRFKEPKNLQFAELGRPVMTNEQFLKSHKIDSYTKHKAAQSDPSSKTGNTLHHLKSLNEEKDDDIDIDTEDLPAFQAVRSPKEFKQIELDRFNRNERPHNALYSSRDFTPTHQDPKVSQYVNHIVNKIVQKIIIESCADFYKRPNILETLSLKFNICNVKPDPITQEEQVEFVQSVMRNLPDKKILKERLNQQVSPPPLDMLKFMRVDFYEDDEEESTSELGRYQFVIPQQSCIKSIQQTLLKCVRLPKPQQPGDPEDEQYVYSDAELVRFMASRTRRREVMTKDMSDKRTQILKVELHCIFDCWNENIISLKSKVPGYSGIGLNEPTIALMDHNTPVAQNQVDTYIVKSRDKLLEILHDDAPDTQKITAMAYEEMCYNDGAWISYSDEALGFVLELDYLIYEEMMTEVARFIHKKIVKDALSSIPLNPKKRNLII